MLGALKSAYEPILQAGPNQEGYSDAEKTAMNTSAMDNSANAYQNADKALNNQYAAAGGGSEYIPSGAQEQMNAGVATAGAQMLAGAQNQITQNDYAQGLTNFNNAANILGGVATGYNSNATASNATSAGTAAYNADAQNTVQNNSLMNNIIGAAGSIGGGLLGGSLLGGSGGGSSNPLSGAPSGMYDMPEPTISSSTALLGG